MACIHITLDLPVYNLANKNEPALGCVKALRLYVGGGTQSGEYLISSVDDKQIEQVEEEVQKTLIKARQEKNY